jgi:hypothetical protein
MMKPITEEYNNLKGRSGTAGPVETKELKFNINVEK